MLTAWPWIVVAAAIIVVAVLGAVIWKMRSNQSKAVQEMQMAERERYLNQREADLQQRQLTLNRQESVTRPQVSQSNNSNSRRQRLPEQTAPKRQLNSKRKNTNQTSLPKGGRKQRDGKELTGDGTRGSKPKLPVGAGKTAGWLRSARRKDKALQEPDGNRDSHSLGENEPGTSSGNVNRQLPGSH